MHIDMVRINRDLDQHSLIRRFCGELYLDAHEPLGAPSEHKAYAGLYAGPIE